MKNNTFISLTSLSMDLKRVALGSYRGSLQVTERFLDEALKRQKEIKKTSVAPHIYKLLNNLDHLKNEPDPQKKAEDALMYSTIFQNYALKKLT